MWFLLACAAVLRPPGPLGVIEDARDRTATVPTLAPPAAAPTDPAVRTASAATRFVGRPKIEVSGTKYRYDCSGLVEAALAAAGTPRTGSSAMLFAEARDLGVLHRRRLPVPGDIAFFDDTYDRDGNGRRDDPLSHSAVVESVGPDGTILLVHVGSKGVTRFHMNLRHPGDAASPEGIPWNDLLRARRSDDSPRTRYLAGELWVGFGSFWRAPAEVATR